MTALQTYLRDLRDIRASGAAVKETSYYGPLATLFNAIGATLKPRVRCIINIANRGAGIPDGGLFTADQFQRSAGEPLPGALPSRGVLEVKSTGDEVAKVAGSAQVAKYLAKYGQVLITNLRDFALVKAGDDGKPALLETYRLAPNEAAFWAAANDPHTLAVLHDARFGEYLKRVMLANAPLSNPSDVAWFLASYARDAKARIEHAALPALDQVRKALEAALGIAFEGERGDHFFRSTLVQTLFYGVFSAWVLWHNERPERQDRFDWRVASYYLRVPVIQALFGQVSAANRLKPLGLIEVLDWTGAALNRVDRGAFFAKFDTGQAVQYFYEPFLQAFDPELRRELGVWYTPPEVIRYMVARVDTALKDELGIADGLADERVYVLDPCCGTGAYLVEVLRHIEQTLRERGEDALLGEDVKRAATTRVFGFELLPAPFVVAHLQLGLLLQNLHAPLGDDGVERVGVYLTNALTGWEPPDAAKAQVVQLQLFGLPELEQERDSATRIKRDAPVLVILGNPPYNGYAGIAIDEERSLSNAYRTTKEAPAPQGQGLNDLYVRFYRMAERRIVEDTGRGVVCYISNYSWLDGLSFTGMRERYLEVFDSIQIDSLNGDKYKTGKLTPEGLPDPSVFSTDFNAEGIQVGTAIATLVRREKHVPVTTVQFRNFWGRAKRAELLDALANGAAYPYQTLQPALPLGLPFQPSQVDAAYLDWPLLPELFPVSFPGIQTGRDDVVVDIDRDRLEARMRQYFDPAISHAEMRQIAPGAMESNSGFQAEQTRDYLRKRGFLPENIVRHMYRPFDVRWLYWEPETKLLDRNRAEYWPNVFAGNVSLAAVQQNRKEYNPPLISSLHASRHVIERGANLFPLLLKGQPTLYNQDSQGEPVANLSDRATEYLAGIGADAADLFYHTLAVLHAPAYRNENSGALRQDWPRVPLPATREVLEASAALGRQLAALLDPEREVPGVSGGALRPELRTVGVLSKVGGGGISVASGDLEITANWGFAGRGGITMPARGKLAERAYSDDERAAMGEEALALLGAATYDIFLNERVFWRNVPERVWDYTIGGYQVLKKWLSYRERDLLGRALTIDEARYVGQVARRIAAMLLLERELDVNYRRVCAATISP